MADTEIEITEALAGIRLDRALSRALPDVSRARLQALIKRGEVSVNGQSCGVRDMTRVGDMVHLQIEDEPRIEDAPEALPLDVLHDDDAIIVLNKSPGQVVHPGAGNRHGTLLNALLHRFPELRNVPRAGIVHRLDKDTSGVMVVARTEAVHLVLVDRIKAREVSRRYQAIVRGRLTGGGEVDAPVGRHPVQRTRMAVRQGGRAAKTRYRVAERFAAHSLLDLELETGRTHQIRVHMAHIRHPVVGDPVYGGRGRDVAGATDALAMTLAGFRRQALHACTLAFEHPVTTQAVEYHAPMPGDMTELLEVLRQDAATRAGSKGEFS